MKNILPRSYPLGSFTKGLTGIEIAVKAREIAGADLEPDTMTWQEDIAGRPQIDGKQIGLARLHQFRGACRLPVTRTQNSIDQIARIAVGMNIDKFRCEIGVDCR